MATLTFNLYYGLALLWMSPVQKLSHFI